MNKEEMDAEYDIIKKVNVEFEVRAHQDEGDEMISCCIPATDTYFSAKSWEDVNKKSGAMIKSFINFWNEYNNNGEKKDFSRMKRDAS